VTTQAAIISRDISRSREHVSASAPLSTVVGFFFAFRLFSVLLAVRVFQLDASVGVAASLVLNYLLLLAAMLSGQTTAGSTWSRIKDQPCFRWVMAYLFLTGLSLSWSVTSSLPAAAAFWVAMTADAVIVMLQLRVYAANVVASSLLSGFVWGSSFIAVIAWLMPAQSDLRLGDEELLGPNQIGWLCGLAFFFAQYLLRTHWAGIWKMHAFILAITMLRSLSKTTIIAFLVAQGFILFRDETIPRKTKIRIIVLVLGVCLVFSGLLLQYYGVYTTDGSGNQSESLTGRVGIWAYIVAEALEKPWFGHGFHSVWKVIPPFYNSSFEARHAHNELIQQFYAYGLAGVALLITTYASIARTIRKFQSGALKTLFGGLLLFVLIRGFADTEVFDLSWPMWLTVLFGALATQQSVAAEVPA
jgi:exopolysaccharide production protein ExoQ